MSSFVWCHNSTSKGRLFRYLCEQFLFGAFYRSVDGGLKPEFLTYIAQLRKVVRRICQRCHSEFCFACGEPISADRAKRSTTAQDDDPLFHCSNLQGVILGVGLSMLEHAFSEQIQTYSESPDSQPRTSKRRKTENSDFRTDTCHISPQSAKKGGIGYAGDHREDVSFH